MDLNSDEFQSTLDVDLILRNLYQFDEISIKDIESLQLLLAGFSFRKISLMIGFDRKTTAKRLTALIKRVGDLYYA